MAAGRRPGRTRQVWPDQGGTTVALPQHVLRISWRASDQGTATAKVEGDIAGEHVSELARVVVQARGSHGRLALDLVDVTFVDQAGAALLRQLRSQGIRLVGGSTFICGLVCARPGGTGAGGVG